MMVALVNKSKIFIHLNEMLHLHQYSLTRSSWDSLLKMIYHPGEIIDDLRIP
jgi:hypothetical protein